MDYQKVYSLLVQRALLENRIKGATYYEAHHVIPKCEGGDNSKNNVILLTAREHFICHQLLTRIYPNSTKLAFALWAMCNQKREGRYYKVASRTYEAAKKKFQELSSALHKGKVESMETRQKKARFGKDNGMYGKKHTQEVKDFISGLNKGRKDNSETRKKKRNSAIGRLHLEETKSKIGRKGSLNAAAIRLVEVETGKVFNYIGEACN